MRVTGACRIWGARVLRELAVQIEQLEAAVAAIEKQLMAWRQEQPCEPAPGERSGHRPDHRHSNRRHGGRTERLPQWARVRGLAGLVPRQNSTGGKHRLGGISKRGNQYLRRLLINGASANLLRSKATNADPWVIGLPPPAAEPGGGGGAGQQDGTHRLGGDAPAGDCQRVAAAA